MKHSRQNTVLLVWETIPEARKRAHEHPDP